MDIASLTPGMELPKLEIGRISRRDLALFAGGSGDHQPIHIDLDAAYARGREDVIAHGMLSMAYLGRYSVQHFPQERIKSFSCRFSAVTPVNAEPTCHGCVSGIADGHATITLRVVLKDGTITAKGEITLALA